jgi:hypothetical protein
MVLFWLTQNVERNSVVRKLQIIKLRGQESWPGFTHDPYYRRSDYKPSRALWG